jgi:hypothetical protein
VDLSSTTPPVAFHHEKASFSEMAVISNRIVARGIISIFEALQKQ